MHLQIPLAGWGLVVFRDGLGSANTWLPFDAPFYSRNVQTCAHSCYKPVQCFMAITDCVEIPLILYKNISNYPEWHLQSAVYDCCSPTRSWHENIIAICPNSMVMYFPFGICENNFHSPKICFTKHTLTELVDVC